MYFKRLHEYLYFLFICVLLCVVSVYLEQSGVEQQSVGSLSIVVALFVEVTQLVQVPAKK